MEHAVEYVAGESSFTLLVPRVACSESAPEESLVSEEGALGTLASTRTA